MICEVAGCDKPVKGTIAVCSMHYGREIRSRARAYGHLNPGAWAERAACIGHQPLFVLPDERGLRDEWRAGKKLTQQINRAKAICRACPSLGDCQRWAMSEPDPAVGLVAGGMTPTERRTARREAG